MKIKPGVAVGGLDSSMLVALRVAEKVYMDLGYALVITSGRRLDSDGLHVNGRAVDIRLPSWYQAKDADLDDEYARARIHRDLGADYDVILEEDHIHIEYDPAR